MNLLDRLKHAWNAFTGNDPPRGNESDSQYVYNNRYIQLGSASYNRPDRAYLTCGNERSIITTIYNRISTDVAAIDIRHVRLDDDGRYKEEIDSGLDRCLTFEANKDQTGRAFIQDIVLSMFDEGCVAVVPIDTTIDPGVSTSYDINTMRVCRIIQWYPDYVKVEAYNDNKGYKEELVVPKKSCAIIENPFYAIMNEPNSVAQRLAKKLALLDVIDAQSGSGKLNMIIQLPYVIKTELRRQQAEQRRQDLEDQLNNSQYGIAYTDGSEHITQLNRSMDNNLMNQIQYLTSTLMSQLGMTENILNGSADEKTMINYMNRIVEPILCAIVDEFKRKFLTKTAISQKQSIMYFNNPFKLVSVNAIADIADKFTRNEIMSSNEVRQLIGLKPVDSPEADELRNKNLNPTSGDESMPVEGTDATPTEESSSTTSADDSELDKVIENIGGYSQNE